MFAVVPRAQVRAAFKVALLVAYLLGPADIAAEHLSSSCRTRARLLVPSSSRAVQVGQAPFALDTALRQQGSPRSVVAPALSFDLNTSVKASAALELDSDSDAPPWDRAFATRLKLTPEPATLPHLLSWLEGWRMDIESGLFRPLRLRASRFAFAYTDIFDTRGHPDKGSHGLGFLFRYDFRKAPDRR